MAETELARKGGFGDGDHTALFELEAGNFWFRARNALLLAMLARHFGEGAGRYLELGCGTGFVLSAIEQRFPALELVGSEPLEEGLDLARQRVTRSRLLQLDARDLPERDAFDVAGAYDVIEHIPEDEAVLGQVFRALVPGGLVVLTVPQHPFLWGPGDEYAHHMRRYTRRELIEKLARAGFEPVRTTSFVSVLLPLMLASRWKQRLAPSAYDPRSEYRIPRWLNRTFEGLLAIERAVILAGLDLPFGGSLLAIARKPKSGG